MRGFRVFATAASAALFLFSCRAVAPGDRPGHPSLLVDVSEQKMFFRIGERLEKTYDVSTSRYGVGSQEGSHRTPLGVHRVAEKFGEGFPPLAVFVDRKPTGRVARANLKPTPTGEDLITSRILWLEGMEPGRNRGGSVDSHERYIYIHGTADEGLIGSPASHGCVRMRNADVIELFDQVPPGTRVEIRL